MALDVPEGKHDGRVRGTRYFQCQPSHGVLVRPSRVVGLGKETDASSRTLCDTFRSHADEVRVLPLVVVLALIVFEGI